MSGVDIAGLVERVGAYLSNGGLFNPELADHDAVRDLVVECRDALLAQAAELAEAQKGLDLLAKHNAEIEAEHEATFDQFESATRQRDVALAALKASEERVREAEIEIQAAKDFGGGFFWEKVSERTRDLYRADARSALENGPAGLADATNNPPSDPGTEQREAGV